MTHEELQQAVAALRWFHRIDLGGGLITPGVDDTPAKLHRLQLPEKFSGRSVLDIGAWDGFFSFEAERRGARRVLATEIWAGRGTKAGFELARRALGSRVEDRRVDVFDLSPGAVGVFDLVLFLGVLYHLRHPLLALERVSSVTGGQLILETHVDMLHCARPACAFYPAGCGPNTAAVIAMLKSVGFRRVAVVSRYSFPYRLARAVKWMFEGRGARFLPTLDQGRLVVHAWR
jgi:tRNA (mo5U34)-methyltransferase